MKMIQYEHLDEVIKQLKCLLPIIEGNKQMTHISCTGQDKGNPFNRVTNSKFNAIINALYIGLEWTAKARDCEDSDELNSLAEEEEAEQ